MNVQALLVKPTYQRGGRGPIDPTFDKSSPYKGNCEPRGSHKAMTTSRVPYPQRIAHEFSVQISFISSVLYSKKLFWLFGSLRGDDGNFAVATRVAPAMTERWHTMQRTGSAVISCSLLILLKLSHCAGTVRTGSVSVFRLWCFQRYASSMHQTPVDALSLQPSCHSLPYPALKRDLIPLCTRGQRSYWCRHTEVHTGRTHALAQASRANGEQQW